MHSRTTCGNQGRSSNSKSCTRSMRAQTLASDFALHLADLRALAAVMGTIANPAFASAESRVTLGTVTAPRPATNGPLPSTTADLGVYVHFPWCLKKCPYCDFLSVAAERPALPH